LRKLERLESVRAFGSSTRRANVGLFNEIIDGRFEQDEGHLVSDSLDNVFVSRELVVHVMLPVGTFLDVRCIATGNAEDSIE